MVVFILNKPPSSSLSASTTPPATSPGWLAGSEGGLIPPLPAVRLSPPPLPGWLLLILFLLARPIKFQHKTRMDIYPGKPAKIKNIVQYWVGRFSIKKIAVYHKRYLADFQCLNKYERWRVGWALQSVHKNLFIIGCWQGAHFSTKYTLFSVKKEGIERWGETQSERDRGCIR